MNKLLPLLVALPLLAQSATHQLSCPTTPPLVGGATRTCTVTLTYGGGTPNITAEQIRVGAGPDVQSIVITAGAGATAAGKSITVNANSAFLAGIVGNTVNSNAIPDGAVIYQIAYTFKPVLTLPQEVLSIAAGDGTTAAAAAVSIAIAPVSVSLPVSNKCDKNNDGAVTIADENVMIGFSLAALNGGGVPAGCDVNGDTFCNSIDVQIIHNAITGACNAQ